MACYSPLKAYPGAKLNPETGKRPMTFSGQKSLIEGTLYTVPCGVCIGCRIDRAEAWAIRATHEAKMAKYDWPGSPGSSFLTLTYRPDAVPADYSVRKDVMQRFMKRLRFKIGVPVRYLLCGEYGERKGRPHFHVLLFGYEFPDRRPWRKLRGNQLYRSELLEEVWTEGSAEIGSVSYQSARYVGGYVVKKLGGERADEAYWRQSPVDGNTYRVEPEFGAMSLKPGLGESWFQKFHGDVFPADHVIVDGQPRKPPRYYEKLYGEDRMKPIKRARKARIAKLEAVTKARAAIMEEVRTLKVRKFEREVE